MRNLRENCEQCRFILKKSTSHRDEYCTEKNLNAHAISAKHPRVFFAKKSSHRRKITLRTDDM